ncbi:cytochrome c [Brevundimonas sp.]|uniref:c-type cytochrome n=1 Tax=Brevundimonas sp. TaxID=1871086 RepID=UPI0035B4F46F
MSRPLVVAALALIVAGCAAREASPAPMPTDPDEQAALRGQRIAAVTCASCHAIAAADASPMPQATPFREIVHRYPLDRLEEAFAEGLVTGHPAMPPFVFRASEIDDLIAYLETVRDEP